MACSLFLDLGALAHPAALPVAAAALAPAVTVALVINIPAITGT